MEDLLAEQAALNGSVSMTENLMDKSFDDDKRNLFEQIKSLLVAKLQAI